MPSLKYEFSRKTKNIARIALVVFIIAAAIYIAGIVTQIITNVAESKEMNLQYNPISCFVTAFNFKYSKFAWIGEGIVLALLLAYSFNMRDGRGTVGKNDKDRTSNFKYSDKDTYGSARQATEAEIRQITQVVPRSNILKIKGNTPIFGYVNEKKKEVAAFPVNDWRKGVSYNGNITILGIAGSMKSRAIVINFIIQAVLRGESCIVNDTKGEIYGWTKVFVESYGYKTKILNLVEQEYSDGWDILGEVENSPAKATQLAATIIDNTGGKDNRDFWAQAEENLLKAIILLKSVGQADASNLTGKKSTMRDVYEFIATKTDAEMDIIFKILEDNIPRHPAIIPYKEYQKADKLRSQISHGLANRLQLFQDEQLSNVLGTKDIDFELAGKEKCIYYLRFSDQQSTYNFVTSLFFTFMYIKLVELADRNAERKLAVKVNIILDELCNTGKILDLEKKVATVRSRGIDTILIAQNIPLFQAAYPDEWESIIGNCSTLLFLGCGNDATTSKFISEMTGEATLSVASNSLMLGDTQMRVTSSTGRGVVFTPDQVRRLPRERMLVFFNGNQVMQLWKMDFTEHPLGGNMQVVNVTDNQTIVPRADRDFDKMIIDAYARRKNRSDTFDKSEREEKEDKQLSFDDVKQEEKPKRTSKKKNRPQL